MNEEEMIAYAQDIDASFTPDENFDIYELMGMVANAAYDDGWQAGYNDGVNKIGESAQMILASTKNILNMLTNGCYQEK